MCPTVALEDGEMITFEDSALICSMFCHELSHSDETDNFSLPLAFSKLLRIKQEMPAAAVENRPRSWKEACRRRVKGVGLPLSEK